MIRLRALLLAIVPLLAAPALAQDAKTVVADAMKAMGLTGPANL